MDKVQKILLPLDLSETDEALLNYASFISPILGNEEFVLMHIIQDQILLPEDRQKMDSIEKAVTEELKEKKTKIYATGKCSIVVKHGNLNREIMQFINENKIDLAIIGLKKHHAVRNILDGDLIRSSNAKILYVPKNVAAQIKNILVPVDFSKFSKMALKQAVFIAEKTGAQVKCLNIVNPPKHFFPYLKDESEEHEEVLKLMKKEFEIFIKEIDHKDVDIQRDYFIAGEEDLGKQIYHYARNHNNDLILLGSGTKSLLHSYFSKNVVKKVTEYDYDIPVLIIKGVKNYIDLWKSILNRK